MDTSVNLPSIARRTETVLSRKGGVELKGTEVVGTRVSPTAGCGNTLYGVVGRETSSQEKSVCRKKDGDRQSEGSRKQR